MPPKASVLRESRQIRTRTVLIKAPMTEGCQESVHGKRKLIMIIIFILPFPFFATLCHRIDFLPKMLLDPIISLSKLWFYSRFSQRPPFLKGRGRSDGALPPAPSQKCGFRSIFLDEPVRVRQDQSPCGTALDDILDLASIGGKRQNACPFASQHLFYKDFCRCR